MSILLFHFLSNFFKNIFSRQIGHFSRAGNQRLEQRQSSGLGSAGTATGAATAAAAGAAAQAVYSLEVRGLKTGSSEP